MKHTNRKFDIAGTVFALLALVCWVPAPLAIKYLSPHLDFWTQNALRYIFAAVMVFIFVYFSKKGDVFEKDLWRKGLIIALPNVVMQCLWCAGLYYLNPAFGTLLAKTAILWTAAMSLIFFADERGLMKSKSFWTGFVIAIIGLVGVTVFKEDFSTAATVLGIIMILGSSLSWALYTIAVKALLKGSDSMMSFAIVSVYTAVFLAILAFIFGEPMQCLNISAGIWTVLILSGLVSLAAAHIFYYAAIKRIGATIPSLAILAQPFLVLLVSRVLFGEYLNGPQWVFGLLLITGSGLAIKAQESLNKGS
jgi:drug/metabolite transporter (DMT)-like permease